MTDLLASALSYAGAGLCALPAHRSQKRPAVSKWKIYQSRLPTASELEAWFANGCDAICLVAGAISGNLELIDFDQAGELFDAWSRKIPESLLAKLVIEASQSGGRHVVYRCETAVGGNLKLAQRSNDGNVVTLIETRGEGGLFLCAPTTGYQLAQGDLANLPVLSTEERETLLTAAWELNEHWPQVPPTSPRLATCGDTASPGDTSRPGDDFNARGDVSALLEKHGWQPGSVRADGNQHWTRPGKPGGTSATLKDRTFYVFSSNAHPFEPNRGYSPFSIYALLEHDGDYEAAARELGQQGYGQSASADKSVDLSAMLATSSEPEEPAAPAIDDPGTLPDALLHVPGFISEVMDHTLAIAPYPNQVMAFGGALALQAFLAGRKVRDSGDNRTNLYLLGLAHSGAGKDQSRKVNCDIIHTVGLGGCLGLHFASGEGIQDALFQNPTMLFQTDEIDGMLQSINRAKDARHEAIMGTMLTMYSSANSVYPMRRKAGKESPGVIDQPCLVIYGTAIPNHYYQALSERMLTNGFFARMIILEAGPRAPGQEPSISDLPPRVLATAQWWASFRPGTGNLEDWHPVPAVIEHSDEAKRLLIATRLEAEAEYSKAEEACDSVGTTVWGRVSEQVRKLALLHAISENHQSPHISLAAVEWASAFVMHQTQRMLFMANQHVADGEFDVLIKRAVEILRQWREKHGTDALMPAWELRRRLKQRPSDFKDIVLELAERRIAELTTKAGITKPKSGYRLL